MSWDHTGADCNRRGGADVQAVLWCQLLAVVHKGISFKTNACLQRREQVAVVIHRQMQAKSVPPSTPSPQDLGDLSQGLAGAKL